MRLWKTSYARRASRSEAGIVSVVTHAVMIAAWVVGTMPPSSLPADSIANRVYYIPPPNPKIVPHGPREVVTFVALAPGPGFGPGPADIDPRRPIELQQETLAPGPTPRDSEPPRKPVLAVAPLTDSVFTEFEVDSAVVRSQNSAAPAYPLDLLQKHVEGAVLARYVVDTTGFADTSSFVVVRSSDSGFVRAVRDALPYMRFSPAKLGARRVRQLVEQSFTFRINPSGPDEREL